MLVLGDVGNLRVPTLASATLDRGALVNAFSESLASEALKAEFDIKVS